MAEYKTTKYTIERPLHLGAALAGVPGRAGPGRLLRLRAAARGRPSSSATTSSACSATPPRPGKPAGDDVREGKRTVLLAIARARATGGPGRVIDERLGDPRLDEAGTAEVRAVITDTGALADVRGA